MQIEIDIESEIEEKVEETIDNMDLTDKVNEALGDIDLSEHIDIDYDDIRYSIEDAILDQVQNHIDMDDIRYNIEDDILNQVSDHVSHDDIEIGDKVYELVFDGCSEVDAVADKLVERAQGGNNDWHILTKGEWQEYKATLDALTEIINIPEKKSPIQTVTDLISSGAVSSATLTTAIETTRTERYQAIRYLTKDELVGWAGANGYGDLTDLTAAEIHEVVC
jgi:hypothetical protein